MHRDNAVSNGNDKDEREATGTRSLNGFPKALSVPLPGDPCLFRLQPHRDAERPRVT
jgi:hypothetical protein